MFEDSTFDSTGRIHTHSRDWMAATFFLNGSILLALILIPLLHPAALPQQTIPFLMQPPCLCTHEQPKPQPVHAAPPPTEIDAVGHIFAPPAIPPGIALAGTPETPTSFNVASMGPEPNGLGATAQVFHGPSVAPIVRPANTGPVRLPSTLTSGLILVKTIPVYPPIALAAHVQGTVVLQATISKTGTIENLRAVSGPFMLQQAALDAAEHWRYRPYLLNGDPVEVETAVNVVFSLGR